MANLEHLARVKQGTAAWNSWRSENPDVTPNLDGVDLDQANLSGVNFFQSSLRGAKLVEADLEASNLNGANLEDADLFKANLDHADLRGALLASAYLAEASLQNADITAAGLSGADLTRANLTWTRCERTDLSNASLIAAYLIGTNLHGANLAGAKLSGAIVGDAVFAENDLSVAIGLESVYHSGPSTIGIDTIFKSKGNIPDVFLRGCGVPDNLIAYVKSLVGRVIEFYSCFISYSSKDQEFADRLYADLQSKGVRCWFAPHDVKGGRKLHEQIDEAIRLHDKLLLVLSRDSMESEWVKTEIAKARKRETRDKRRVLFPIRLVPFEVLRDWECFDADTGKDSAREIREYFIPDFSNWKDHDSYQEALKRLVDDLKAQDSAAPV